MSTPFSTSSASAYAAEVRGTPARRAISDTDESPASSAAA
jgi:hypothetical protein